MTTSPLPLLRRTTCPHCWASFPLEELLWVSAHADLRGDPRLGPDQQQRFLPTRFTLEGKALDAHGFVCETLACPRCHLTVPRALLEMEPIFISILGTPACGKSFFLATMTWQLRRLLPQHFGLSFMDADPLSNRTLNEYEESLFLNPQAEHVLPLGQLIRKTDIAGGDLYDRVSYGSQEVRYPRPFLFSMQPQPHHPSARKMPSVARALCLYDNAGEHFHVGQDSTSAPVTRHLTQARLLMYLFDPLQDPRFRQLCRSGKAGSDPRDGKVTRQETVLVEAADRVRRALGLSQSTRHNRPLIVVVTKRDAWGHVLKTETPGEPWRSKDGLAGLDVDWIQARSTELRALLGRVCPEVVRAAEGFAENVVYIAVSALGREPTFDPATQVSAIRPADISPSWVTVPLLYGLCRWATGLVPAVRRPSKDAGVHNTRAWWEKNGSAP